MVEFCYYSDPSTYVPSEWMDAGSGLYHAVILDFSPCNTTGSRLNGSFCCATGQEACRVVCEPTQTIGDGNAQDEDQIKRQKAL